LAPSTSCAAAPLGDKTIATIANAKKKIRALFIISPFVDLEREPFRNADSRAAQVLASGLLVTSEYPSIWRVGDDHVFEGRSVFILEPTLETVIS
jgi:hypothetical protein